MSETHDDNERKSAEIEQKKDQYVVLETREERERRRAELEYKKAHYREQASEGERKVLIVISFVIALVLIPLLGWGINYLFNVDIIVSFGIAIVLMLCIVFAPVSIGGNLILLLLDVLFLMISKKK